MSNNNLVAPPPEHCPGTQSEKAGKESACAGCPNQTICASGQAREADPAVSEIGEKLKDVKHKVMILSGKGGVGKSTFTAQLAFELAGTDVDDGEICDSDGKGVEEEENEEAVLQVGIMDVDICGPSIPQLVGVEGAQVHTSSMGWEPVYVQDNLAVMSIGFLLKSQSDAVIWRGPKKNGLIKQFLRDVYWGPLDFLLIDTPPGTSDEHLSLAQYLKEASVDGAIIITTPQEVSLQDVRKEINFCRKVGINIIGVVENFSGFVCPNCKNTSNIFAPSTGGASVMCEKMNVPFLGKIPLDPLVAQSCEEGRRAYNVKGSPSSLAFAEIFKKIKASVSP